MPVLDMCRARVKGRSTHMSRQAGPWGRGAVGLWGRGAVELWKEVRSRVKTVSRGTHWFCASWREQTGMGANSMVLSTVTARVDLVS